MGMVSALTQGEWLAGYFLGVITAPVYFASPENGWADTLLTRLFDWSVVSDHHAAVAFYEGLPAGAAFPWGSWIVPIFWWGCFFLAFFAANLCLMVVFRRQWMDYERLPFPLAAGLLELTGEHGQRGALMELLRNPRFKIGFFVAFFVFSWDIVSWFTELIPPLQANIDRQIFIGEGFPYLRFKTNPLTIAFGYFTESNVLFSIWFFHLVMVLQVGLMNRLGFEMGSPRSVVFLSSGRGLAEFWWLAWLLYYGGCGLREIICLRFFGRRLLRARAMWMIRVNFFRIARRCLSFWGVFCSVCCFSGNSGFRGGQRWLFGALRWCFTSVWHALLWRRG